MSEIWPRRGDKNDVEPKRLPHVVVPVPIGEVRDFVRHAVKGTSLVDPVAQVFSGFVLFEQRLRYTAVDATHTRIEIDVSEKVPGADVLLYTRRVGVIDRFFVAVQDELDSRERRYHRPEAKAAVTEQVEFDTSVDGT
ncbi:hypothetical protein B7R21_19575 [Subtercola boreus]|uniref:Uncharacterized protein n=1 Tax=Subtercola boreus TaxID=120213 RepID=A0A3E0VA63_9MICO|nr:hypothetical protein B7R21_19575 [Subtercola boreus]